MFTIFINKVEYRCETTIGVANIIKANYKDGMEAEVINNEGIVLMKYGKHKDVYIYDDVKKELVVAKRIPTVNPDKKKQKAQKFKKKML